MGIELYFPLLELQYKVKSCVFSTTIDFTMSKEHIVLSALSFVINRVKSNGYSVEECHKIRIQYKTKKNGANEPSAPTSHHQTKE